MKKALFLLVMVAMFAGQAIATPVTVNQAKNIGLKYAQRNASKQVSELSLAYTQMTESGTPALYVFNFSGGFVMVSADDVAQPILAFGEDDGFDANNIPDGLSYYLRHYARQIDYAVTNGLAPEPDVTAQWRHVERDGFVFDPEPVNRNVQPLTTTTWNQDYPYNYYCPTGQGGPGGRAYAGCAATAMSIVMKFWNWPVQGTGEYSYTPEGYPTQTVNFGATTYDWANMPNSISSNSPMVQIQAVATLMYHCGVSIDMMYGPGSSGAYSQDVPDAIATYFSYTDHAVRLDRDLYTRSDWEDLLILMLEQECPLYYSGSDPEGGHAFVCDGYRSSDRKFHFNWGWSGYGNNSYYAIDALNVMGSQLNDNQAAIFDMLPDYIYNGMIPAADNLEVYSENSLSKTGFVVWTNPTTSLDGSTLQNIDEVVLMRNDQVVFSQSNVTPGAEMVFEDEVPEYDCYTYRLYYLSNNVKGRSAFASIQYGPKCTWKVIGQTTNFQGWNNGKLQVLNQFGTVVDEITMTSSTPISRQISMPMGAVSFKWVAPTTTINSLTINVKNSSNVSVYSYSGASTGLNGVVYSDDNDCSGCLPPTDLAGQYQWTNEGFGTLLTWSYDGEPQSFKIYRSTNGLDYEEVGTADKLAREYFDQVEVGTYYYQVTAYRSYCESTPAFGSDDEDYVLINVTSIGEGIEKNDVFPNPANESLCVNGMRIEDVVVYNMTGQVVYRKSCNKEDGLVINTSSFAPGVYVISIKSETNGTAVRRFSVVH